MRKKIVLNTMMIFLLFSCKEEAGKVLLRDVTIGNILAMKVPAEIKFFEGNGIDSYVAYLVNHKKDTFHIEYGRKGIINNLYESNIPVLPMSQKETIVKRLGREPSSDEVIFSAYPKEDTEQKIFEKNFFLYDTVNTIVVKLILPKKIGNGITGLYVPDLKDGKSFSIYAHNLNSVDHQKALKMFKTIKYQ